MSEQEKVKSLIEGFLKLNDNEKSAIEELVEKLSDITSATKILKNERV